MRRALQVTRTPGGIVRALGAAVLFIALCALRLEAAAAEPVALSSEAKASVARATDAANRGRWNDVHDLAVAAKDPLARALITWLYLTDEDTEPAFGEATQFLADHPDWPDRDKILRKAEKALPADMRTAEVLAFFGAHAPLTGEGMVRLGEAMLAQGDANAGETLIKKGWIQGDFTLAREQQIRAAHGALLRGAPTAARVDRLLWDRRLSDAQRIIGDVDGEAGKLAQARITMMTAPGRADAIISGLPSALRTDSGLLFEQVRAVNNTGDTRRALPLALKADPSASPNKWWSEREELARDALALGLYSDAYELAKSHGLTSGADFADAEWLAGFIALRFLNKPDVAYGHFQALLRGVNYPVSKARAAYWSGRAAEAANKLADAVLMYEAAAEYSTTFYGQLAAVRLADRQASLALPTTPAPSGALRDTYLKDEVVRATALAASSNYEPLYKRFFLFLAERAQSPEDYALAGEFARNLGYPQYAVRVAKKAMQQNIVLTSLAYPVVSVPTQLAHGRTPEPALVLGLSRQESEFDSKAVSSAGARGIMQLLPSTAKLAARQQSIGFDAGKLSDPTYNAKLGSAYLGSLIDNFGGSYALAIAAYNAGPSRVRQWMSQNGDPRDPKVDVIDWVELIPFDETRNYVQRVLENTQVYRERLAGKPVLIRIAEDLSRPSFPNQAVADLNKFRTLSVAASGKSKSKSEQKSEVASAAPAAPAAPAVPAAAQTVAMAEPVASAPATPVAKPAPSSDAATAAKAGATAPQSAPAAAAPTETVVSAEPSGALPVPAVKPAAPESPAPKPAAAPAASAKPALKPETATATAATTPPQTKPEPSATATTVVASADAPAQTDPPETNPFNAGQPETIASSNSCMRLLMAKDGKLRCAQQSASLP